LLYWYLVDDAFYYFEISRHFPEANVRIPTSGFRPLYALLLIPIRSMWEEATAIRLSLFILALASAINVGFIYALLRRCVKHSNSLLAAASLSASGMMYTIALTRVETVLAISFVSTFFLF